MAIELLEGGINPGAIGPFHGADAVVLQAGVDAWLAREGQEGNQVITGQGLTLEDH